MDTIQTTSVEATPPADPDSTNETVSAPVVRTGLNRGQGLWLTHAERVIANAYNDVELAAALQARGYPPAKLLNGLAILAAARAAMVARQTALADQLVVQSEMNAQLQSARVEYANFRIVARSVLASPDATAALLLDDRIAMGAWRFVNMAHVTYQTVLERPAYLELLEPAGYTPEIIQSLDAGLDGLMQVVDAHRSARANIVGATDRRNAALKQAASWYHRFRNVARVAVRSRPDLATRLGIHPL